MKGWTRSSAVIVVAFASLSTTGCGLACHDQGYHNVLDLHVTDSPETSVAAVEFCFDGECLPGRQVEPDSDSHTDATRWAIELFVSAPAKVTVKMFDSSASELGSKDVDISWAPTWSPNGPGCDNESVAAPIYVNLS